MKSLMHEIFGTYTPVTYEAASSDGLTTYDVIPDGLSGCDWTYIGEIFIFGIALYCVFRLVGMVFNR